MSNVMEGQPAVQGQDTSTSEASMEKKFSIKGEPRNAMTYLWVLLSCTQRLH